MHERQLFESALELTDPQARQAFLDKACQGDQALRAKVDALLQSHATAGSFLDIPAADQMEPGIDSSTTNTIVGAPGDDSAVERASGEAEFRKYLQPATRPGWMGRLGHYEIEAILGRGAFGIVAKAFDEKLHRVVAIKLMNPELASTSPPRQRFLREARTAAAVPHENIVAIHAVEEQPLPYLVMEYIPGQTLQQRMDAKGPFDAKEILRIGQQVAAGLAAAHGANLIHRDIKPSNILLSGGPAERAKISDFGLARAVDDATMTSSGLIAGTPMYMAPEQARGETLDHRADLFSLGSVLYQMASGRPPFRAANTVAVLKRVCEDTPRPLDDVLPGIPGWLETIIFKLLEKNRDDRYQTAQEVADLLARCQSELQHQGRVTCVPGRPAAVETQVLPARRGDRSASGRWPIGWLAGGVIAVVAVMGLVLINGGRQNPEGNAAKHPAQIAFAATPQTPSETPAVAGWHGWPADAPAPALAPFDEAQAKKHQEAWAKYLGVPVAYTNSLGMKFRLIPPGDFLMGSTPEEIEPKLKRESADELTHEYLHSEVPVHHVILTHPIYLGVHEVTQGQYEEVIGSNPSYFAAMGGGKDAIAGIDTNSHPVEGVSWSEATGFCVKLSQLENHQPFYSQSGETVTLQDGTGYRLPTEAEWERACRAGSTNKPEVDTPTEELLLIGWFGENSGGCTHAVGKLKSNSFGLHDTHGNVWEWTQDWWAPDYYGGFREMSAINPAGPAVPQTKRVVRGSDHRYLADDFASFRGALPPPARDRYFGFRVTLTVDAVRQALKVTGPAIPKPVATTPSASASAKLGWQGWPADAPPPAIAPFDAAQAKKHQEAWAKYLQIEVEYTNALGMKFVLIPPGEFTMGSTAEEIAAALKEVGEDKHWQECIQSEAPQHKVILTQPIYLGVNEVTQAEYEKVMGVNPSHFARLGAGKEAVAGLETTEHPVETVSWNDAAEFSAKLSKQEKLKPFYFRTGETITPLDGTGYRLPSEAEWEFACRAGTATKYWIGDQDEDLVRADWFGGNSGGRTHAAGELKANPFGLSDIHGNVWEWVQDGWDATYYGQFSDKPAINPNSPFSAGSQRVLRGGRWFNSGSSCRSSYRYARDPTLRSYDIGFRVSLVAVGSRVSR